MLSDGLVAFWDDLKTQLHDAANRDVWPPPIGQLVHCADREIVRTSSQLCTNLIPQPWVGPLLNAKVYILQCNPGYSSIEDEYENAHPRFRQALIDNLAGTSTNMFLQDEFSGHPGARWTKRIFRGLNLELVKFVVCLIELVPYHSEKNWAAKKIAPKLPSTQAAKRWIHQELVPRAEQGDITLIIQRCARLWGFLHNKDESNLVVYGPGYEARSGFMTYPTMRGGRAIARRFHVSGSIDCH